MAILTVQGVSSFLIKADQICDFVPILSTVNNVVDLFLKNVSLPRSSPPAIKASHYYTYLNEKTFTRSILLLIPVLGQIIVYLADQLYDDKMFALEQVRKNGLNLKDMSKRLQNNKEVVLAATLNNPAAFLLASKALQNSKSFTCEVIKARKDDLVLKYTTARPRNSKSVLLVAIEQNGLALQWAGGTPRSSQRVVKAAILKNFYAFMYADSALQNDKEFVLELIALEPRIALFLSKELQEDIDVKRALNKANSTIGAEWNDEAFVLTKVRENPFLFKNASPRLKGSKEFVLKVIRAHIESVVEARKNGSSSTQIKSWIFSNFVSRELKEDREVKLAIHASEKAAENSDREVVLANVRLNGLWGLKEAPLFQNDREVVLAAVRQNGMALMFAHSDLKKDMEIVLAAVQSYGCALQLADPELRKNREIVLGAVRQDGLALQYAYHFKDDKEIVLIAVSKNGDVIEYASARLQEDPDVKRASQEALERESRQD